MDSKFSHYVDVLLRVSRLVVVFLFALGFRNALSQELLRDINLLVDGPGPEFLVAVGENTFFGVENRLWISDGTEAGTELVDTIILPWTNEPIDGIENLTEINGLSLFVAWSGNEHNIWSSDGTADGTIPLTEFGSPFRPNSMVFREWVAFDDVIVFTIRTDNGVNEMWYTDGTKAGTHIVQTTVLEPNVWFEDLTVAGNTMYFSVDKLWKMNSADSIPEKVSEASSVIVGAAGDNLYYWNEGSGDGTDGSLWRTNGTDEAPQFVSNVYPGMSSNNIGYVGDIDGKLLFIANTSVGSIPFRLWISDGTAAGTTQIKEVKSRSTTTLKSKSITWYTPSTHLPGNRLLFSAKDKYTGYELWVTDGTAGGTKLLQDISPGKSQSAPDDMITVDGIAYVSARNSAFGRELWRSDGTSDGTWLVTDINLGEADASPRQLRATESGFLFSASDGVAGRALWFSDGTDSGTQMVADVYPDESTGHSSPRDMVVFDDHVFFSANDGRTDRELWVSDGKPDGTLSFREFSAASDALNSFPLAVTGNKLFTRGSNLWSYAGGNTPMILLTDPRTGPFQVGPVRILDGEIAFEGRDFSNGSEMWISDGTVSGTFRMTDIPGNETNSVSVLGKINQRYIYSARVNGEYNLYSKALPTDSPALLVERLSSNIQLASRLIGNTLLFAGPGQILYKTDGTPGGTGPIMPGTPSFYLKDVLEFARLGDIQFVSTKDTGAGLNTELWRSDGTAAGTWLVKDIAEGPAHSSPTYLIADPTNSRIFFTAQESEHGRELWISDGTEEGTTLVSDITPGPSDTFIEPLLVHEGRLIFSADDGIHGKELWISDGTAENTYMMVDFWAGPESSWPMEAVVLDGYLIVSMKHPNYGRELWKVDLETSSVGTTAFDDIPTGFELYGNYPNPFYPQTTITFSLSEPADIELVVYDILGKRVRTMASGHHMPGRYDIRLDAGDLASGVYFYSLISSKGTETRKMILVN